MGETCGMKLVDHPTIQQPGVCKWCEKVATKLRKRKDEMARIARWEQEGKNPASLEKARQNVHQMDRELQTLYDEITRRRADIGGNRRPAANYGAYAPPQQPQQPSYSQYQQYQHAQY